MSKCMCGHDTMHTILLAYPSGVRGLDVILYNVPVEVCTYCEKQWFALEDRVASAFNYARNNGLKDLDFNVWKVLMEECATNSTK